MSPSLAKIEANRKNALLSCGPKTPEGKEASRRNAIKHGLTGAGIVVPADDVKRIADVAKMLRFEHQPTTTIGSAMVDHLAMLVVRLDRSGRHDLAIVADQVDTAVYDFNQARRDWADELFDGLETNPAGMDELRQFPEGIDRLIEGFSSLATVEDWSSADLSRVAILSDTEGNDSITLRDMISEQIRRLEAERAAIDTRPIEMARARAADLALFGMSPEAILARKYEAATERSLHKALKAFHEAESANQTPTTPETPTPTEPVGSFLPEPSPPPQPRPMPEPVVDPVAPEPPVKPHKRPDPKKLREAMRRKRR